MVVNVGWSLIWDISYCGWWNSVPNWSKCQPNKIFHWTWILFNGLFITTTHQSSNFSPSML